MKLDVLCLAAHPDDIEFSCGATVALMVRQGSKIGIIDFTRGELGSRGTPEIRAQEAATASEILGIHARENLGLPDGNIANTKENQLRVIQTIRQYRPHIMFINSPKDRHPDHPAASELSLSAIFYAGLRKVETLAPDGTPQAPWRPSHVLHYMQSDLFEPTFVVDVTETWDVKLASMRAFKSQFWSPDYNPDSDEPETFISSPAFTEWIDARGRTFGYRIGAKFAEPFLYANGPLAVRNLGEVLKDEKPY